MLTKDEAIHAALVMLDQSTSTCGCIGVMTAVVSATVRYGECSPECSMFVGCPRSKFQAQPAIEDEKHRMFS